jgi:hypothetical protein
MVNYARAPNDRDSGIVGGRDSGTKVKPKIERMKDGKASCLCPS